MSCCEDVEIIGTSFFRYLRARTWFELLMSFFCWLLLIFGSAGRFVFLDKFRNFVPNTSPPDPFALEFMSDLFVFGFFGLAFLIYVIVKRPDLTYLRHKRGIACIIISAVGFASAFYLQHYAAPKVDPALRHISALVLVVLTSIIAYVMETGPGNGGYSWLHIFPFAFCIGGVVLAGAGSLKRLPQTVQTEDEQAWLAIFIVSYIPQSIALVAVTYYMKRYLIFREQDLRRERGADYTPSANSPSRQQPNFVAILGRDSLGPADDDNDDRFDFRAQKRTDPLTGRITFSFFMTLLMLVVTLLLSPTDIAPFFGTSNNATNGLERVKASFQCVFQANTVIEQSILYEACDHAWKPFLELTASSSAQVVGLMFALTRTPFGAAQAIVLGITSLSSLLRSTWPEQLSDPGAKVGETNLGESLGAVALSLFAVIITFIVEEDVRLLGAPRRSALVESTNSVDVQDPNTAVGRGGGGERSGLLIPGGGSGKSGKKKRRTAEETDYGISYQTSSY